MARRIQHDPVAVLRLEVMEPAAAAGRPGDGCVQVVDRDVEVFLDLLLAWPARPGGWFRRQHRLCDGVPSAPDGVAEREVGGSDDLVLGVSLG